MGNFKKIVVLLGFLAMLIIPGKLYSSVSAASAGNLTSGVSVTKTIKSHEDHSYTFTTNKDGEIYLTLGKSSDGMRVWLQDEYGNTIESDDYYNGGSALTIRETVSKGTYRVYVSPYDWDGISSSKYNLKVTYPGKITRNKTSFEPNDTMETAYTLTNGKITNSTLESNLDVDKYKFTTNKDGQIFITLDGSSAGAYLILYDEFGNMIDSKYFSRGSSTASIRYSSLKGTYYIGVRPNGWNGVTSSKYRLKATFAAPFKRDANLESNDTFETAYPMISEKAYTSTSFSYYDTDMFKFTTSKSGRVAITLDKNDDGYELYLYDNFGNHLKTSYTRIGGSYVIIDETLGKGTYFVRVEPYDWDGTTSSSYRVRASFEDKVPTVSSVSNLATVIKGKAETGTKVHAYVGSKSLGSATAVGGKYTIKIAKQKVKTSINVYTVDKAGVRSRSKNVKVIDKTPKVNAVSNASTTIKGSAETSAKVYAYVGKKLIGSTTASSGKYTIKIAKQKAKAKISVHIVDKSGVKSASRTVTVADKIAPIKPTVSKVTTKSIYVSGKTEASAKVYIYNGKKYVATGTVNSKGSYKIKIAKQKKGSTINVYALDAAKNKSKITSVKVK